MATKTAPKKAPAKKAARVCVVEVLTGVGAKGLSFQKLSGEVLKLQKAEATPSNVAVIKRTVRKMCEDKTVTHVKAGTTGCQGSLKLVAKPKPKAAPKKKVVAKKPAAKKAATPKKSAAKKSAAKKPAAKNPKKPAAKKTAAKKAPTPKKKKSAVKKAATPKKK